MKGTKLHFHSKNLAFSPFAIICDEKEEVTVAIFLLLHILNEGGPACAAILWARIRMQGRLWYLGVPQNLKPPAHR